MSEGHVFQKGDCVQCNEDWTYTSLTAALHHLHSAHTNCPLEASTNNIFEDPCTAFIKESSSQTETFTNNETTSACHSFYTSINSINKKVQNIHCSVSGTSDENGTRNLRPHLLTNLVHAFEEIVAKFVVAGRFLKQKNLARLQIPDDRDGVALVPLNALEAWEKEIDDKITELLNLARRDVIILGTSKRDIDRLIIAPVGPECLLATIIANVENNTMLQGNHRRVDIIRYYRKLTARLRFGAISDPKRKRFLEISALEEELEALRALVHVQRRLTIAYRNILDPAGFDSIQTDWSYLKDRHAMFRLERTLLNSQNQKLAEDDDTLRRLQMIASGVRNSLKQNIEILEEGHGKAIRVFTIVTLFFLPLSFVTSFFGMNTKDVRDIDWDQKLFWMSALPVTIGVMATAFVYGYKWDSVASYLSVIFPTQKAVSPRHISRDDMMPLMEDKVEDRTSHNSPAGETPRSRWPERLSHRITRRQGKTGRGIPRRQTGDSLLI
ncbi:hypothetical protein BDP55DRAFT_143885 [Colletotrichum godetiae]|uniref:CorA-like Mg2+ transporter n=1 Tax=Colletotrichum godetiae TaxID=1209918 RepID=A0AAJ0AZN5_9PEZI|nr:uncharacterized protein BDP55DRAFT_143885 [Colletotrichum godetiae]KAK1700766.1 hypothetical protein BDP55DRAFT_143885 [Colletotrichum godetiae]